MDCAELEANLTNFLEGELDQATETRALEHLATCERCEAVLSQTRSIIELAHRHGRQQLESSAREQLLTRILSSTRH